MVCLIRTFTSNTRENTSYINGKSVNLYSYQEGMFDGIFNDDLSKLYVGKNNSIIKDNSVNTKLERESRPKNNLALNMSTGCIKSSKIHALN